MQYLVKKAFDANGRFFPPGDVYECDPELAGVGLERGIIQPLDEIAELRSNAARKAKEHLSDRLAEATADSLMPPPRPRWRIDADVPRHLQLEEAWTDFVQCVSHRHAKRLHKVYGSHKVDPGNDGRMPDLTPKQKSALAESGGGIGGYTVPPELIRQHRVRPRRAELHPAAGPRRSHGHPPRSSIRTWT